MKIRKNQTRLGTGKSKYYCTQILVIGHPMSQQSVPITGNEKGVSSQSISEPDKVTTAQWGQNISEVDFNLICQ